MSATRKFQVIGFPKPKVQVIAKRAENKASISIFLPIKEWTKKIFFDGSERENFESCERAKRVRKFLRVVSKQARNFEGCERAKRARNFLSVARNFDFELCS